MSKEAMKLACKALRDCHYYMINAGLPNQSLLNEAFTAYMELEAALAKQPAQQEPVAAAKKDAVFEASIEFIGTLTGMKPPPIEVAPPEILKPFRDFTEKVCLIFAAPQPAQQEPVAWQYRDSNDDGTWGAWLGCDKRLAEDEYRQVRALFTSPQPAPVQQEPVAVVSGYYGGQCVILPIDPARIFNSNTPLYTAPSPCPTCEALARTVMLDQTSHDTHRKPTDEMVVAAARMLSDRQAAACNVDCGDMWKLHGNDFIDDARAALEAAHGIGENK